MQTIIATADAVADPGLTEEFMLKMTALAGGLTIAAAWIVMKNLREIGLKRQSEMTRREIAAYVAEGSIKPEDAAALLCAGSQSETEKSIAAAVQNGVISPAKAEKIFATLRSSERAPRPS